MTNFVILLCAGVSTGATGAVAPVDFRGILYFSEILVKNRIFKGEILHLSLMAPVNSKP